MHTICKKRIQLCEIRIHSQVFWLDGRIRFPHTSVYGICGCVADFKHLKIMVYFPCKWILRIIKIVWKKHTLNLFPNSFQIDPVRDDIFRFYPRVNFLEVIWFCYGFSLQNPISYSIFKKKISSSHLLYDRFRLTPP